MPLWGKSWHIASLWSFWMLYEMKAKNATFTMELRNKYSTYIPQTVHIVHYGPNTEVLITSWNENDNKFER